jgi:hypothetical protein
MAEITPHHVVCATPPQTASSMWHTYRRCAAHAAGHPVPHAPRHRGPALAPVLQRQAALGRAASRAPPSAGEFPLLLSWLWNMLGWSTPEASLVLASRFLGLTFGSSDPCPQYCGLHGRACSGQTRKCLLRCCRVRTALKACRMLRGPGAALAGGTATATCARQNLQ